MFASVGGPQALLNTLQLIPGGWISNLLQLFSRVPILDFGTLLPLTACHTPLFLVTLSSLTLLAILSTAAPLASLSNSVNSGNYGFDFAGLTSRWRH